MDESLINEPRKRITPAGVDNGRSSRQQGLRARLSLPESFTQGGHAFGNVVDDVTVRTLGRHLRLHEAEYVAIPWPLQRHHANSRAARDDQFTPFHYSHRKGTGGRLFWIDADAKIHFSPLHTHPVSSYPDLSRQMGRRIEILGQNAVRRGRLESAVGLAFNRGPVGLNPIQDVTE